MQRLVGYLFLIAAGAAGVIALIDRFSSGSLLTPGVNSGPDWLGIALVGAALGCGAALLLVRKNPDAETATKEPDDEDS